MKSQRRFSSAAFPEESLIMLFCTSKCKPCELIQVIHLGYQTPAKYITFVSN